MLTDKEKEMQFVRNIQCGLGEGEIIQVQIMFNGKNKNEGKTQMVQQLEVICAMIPVHICQYNPESGLQISKKQQPTIIKYTGNDIFCICETWLL